MPPEHKYSLPPGCRLRQYVVVRLLGHGGFGLTYLADDTKLNRKVAIKELLPMDFALREKDGTTVVARSQQDGISLQWARQRFVEEGQTLAGLHHPSILPIYEIFEEHGTAYLVTAFIEGESLEDWLRKVQRPAERDLRSIAICLLDALELVHERGYLHRDVKPENILMDRLNRRPVLIDFGNARVASGARSSNLTAVLTKGYAPFEQYQSKGRQGPFTDIYALGAVLYRAIKGVAPDDAADRWEDDKIAPLCQRPPAGYGREFLATVDKALKMRREDRWQKCAEWKAALGVADELPLLDPKPSKVGLAVAALGVLAVAGVGIGLWINHPAEDDHHLSTPDLSNTGGKDPRASPTPVIPPGPGSPTPGVATPRIAIASLTPTPAPAPPPPAVTPDLATADHPFVNSLEMKFVKVPVRGGPSSGRTVLFCMHETRKRDYREYAKSDSNADKSWQDAREKGVPVSETDEHPVVNVSLDDAKSFCAWLSRKEGLDYRLPTDYEWSCAAGLEREDPGDSPVNKSRANKDIFPWGRLFNPLGPPVGNYADNAMKRKFGDGIPEDSFIKGYNDGYATTAPVMQFPGNNLGIYDLGGNVMEWCDSDYYSVDKNHLKPMEIRRGGSWKTCDLEKLSSSSRNAAYADSRETDVGFRCVLVLSTR
jgi:serine/threonine protein kinase